MRHHRCLPTALATVGTVLLSACSPSPSDRPPAAVVRDSAGITIVEHPAELVAPAEWTLSLEDAVRIDGEFSRVRHGVRMDDGRVVVADGDSRTLRLHAADGAPLATIGRSGGGPGEFRTITSLSRWPGDSLLVFDVQQRRLTVFDDTGGLARSFVLATSADVPFGNVQGTFGDGSMLAIGYVSGGPPQPGRSTSRSPAYRFAPDGELSNVYAFGIAREAFFESFEGGGFSITDALFARLTMLRAGRALLVEADNARFELKLRTPDGTLRRVVRRAGEPPAVTPALRAAAVEQALGALPDDAARGRMRPVLDGMPVPATVPAFGDVHVDRLDHVWVAAYAAVPGTRTTWWVFAPDGALAARATMPARLTPLDIGRDYLLGVSRDELDVESVVMVSFER